LSDLAEEILSLISKKGEIGIKEIKDRLNVSKETLTTEIDFLVEAGFVKLDKSKRYIRLSNRCKKFLEETSERDIGSIFLLC
jgi:Mn-dependent DtxR family transcriptional regulator